MPTDDQAAWLLSVLGFAPEAATFALAGAGPDAAPGAPASGPQPAAAEALTDGHGGPQVGTTGATIRIINGTGADLKLVSSTLLFPATASFAPAPPPIVPGRDGNSHTDVFFAVVDPTAGSAQAGGTAQYHIERRVTNSFFSFSWSGGKGNLKVDGPYSTAFHGETDSEAGDFYEFILKEADTDLADLQIQINILNQTGVDLVLSQAKLDDPAKTEFNLKPPSTVPNKTSKTFFVQPLDSGHPAGAGTVVYQVPGTPASHAASLSWIRDGKPTAAMSPNDGAFAITRSGTGRLFDFTIATSGAPPASAGGDTTITVINRCGFELGNMIEFLDNTSATFKTKPPETIANGATVTFEILAPDPHAPETDGSVSYSIDPDDKLQAKPFSIALEWKVGATPTSIIAPATQGFAVQSTQTGDAITFTITGPALDFTPPPKVKQPTLRKGDKSADGWVEYLQQTLNHHLKAGLTADGDFGPATLKAVTAFQTQHKADGCLVDGVVGDQTWAFLREGAPEKPATDGRKPHSFKEDGLEARWLREKGIVAHDKARDAFVLQLVSVGDLDAMQDRKVRVRVTAPDKTQTVQDFPIGPALHTTTTGEGSQHEVLVTPLSTLFAPSAPAPAPAPGDYQVESFFDQELGGDSFSETVTIAP